MKHTISTFLICCVTVIIHTLPGSAQPYFSKQVRTTIDRTLFRGGQMVDGESIVLSTTRSKFNTYMNQGWLRYSTEGELLDSFFFKTERLREDGLDGMVLYGDTVFQVAKDILIRDAIHIYGSSLSRKDSLLHYVYDFSHVPDLSYIYPSSTLINSAGNLVIFGHYVKPTTPKNTYVLFLFEITLDGEVVNWHEVVDIFAPGLSFFQSKSKLIESPDGYFSAIFLDRYIEYGNARLVKMDKSGHLQWITPGHDRPGAHFVWWVPNITFSLDSSEVYLVHQRMLKEEDLNDPSEIDSMYLYYGVYVMIVSSYCPTSGMHLWDRTTYLKERSQIYYPYRCITSSINGDIIIVGQWFDGSKDIETGDWPYEMGLIARVNPETGFVWTYKVVDQFGHLWTYGNNLFGVNELENGDLLCHGHIHNNMPPYGNPGWLVRLPPNGCPPNGYCQNDTISMNTFTTGTADLMHSFKTQYLDIYPNPSRPGNRVYFSSRNKKPISTINRVVIRDMQGRIILAPQSISILSDETGYLDLPPELSSGTYIIELFYNTSDRYSGKLVVE